MNSSALPWLSLSIALLALAINGWTFVDRRRIDRRDLFMKLHEAMLEPDLQRGRMILYRQCGSKQAVEKMAVDGIESFLLANRALAMFDLMARYVETGHIDREDAMEEWAYSTSNLYVKAEHFLAYRSAEAGRRAWTNFVDFAEAAAVWRERNPR
ncbi:MAG: hypothetical protein ACJ72L_18590 [Marmoricola sp.]